MKNITQKFLFLLILISLISCGDDNDSATVATSSGTGSFKKIYLASLASPTGDNGIGAFDAACNTGYKALAGGASRHPDISNSGAVDWVLEANKEYRRDDGTTVIGRTNANAVFTFPLTNSFGSSAGKYYTGFSSTWTSASTINCDDWGSMADDRTYGDALSTNSNAISEGLNDCGTSGPSGYVVCVEQ